MAAFDKTKTIKAFGPYIGHPCSVLLDTWVETVDKNLSDKVFNNSDINSQDKFGFIKTVSPKKLMPTSLIICLIVLSDEIFDNATIK